MRVWIGVWQKRRENCAKSVKLDRSDDHTGRALWVARYTATLFELRFDFKVRRFMDFSLVVWLNNKCEEWKRFLFEFVWFELIWF